MNEYHYPIVCGRWDNGGLAFMYECMQVCKNVFILSLYICIYVFMYACMCVSLRLANDFINVKTETKVLHLQLPVALRRVNSDSVNCYGRERLRVVVNLKRRYRNIRNEWMNIIFPLSEVDGIMGGLVLCMNSCVYARIYVYFCICMSGEWLYQCQNGNKIVGLLWGNTFTYLLPAS